jgi:hypothetical protein
MTSFAFITILPKMVVRKPTGAADRNGLFSLRQLPADGGRSLPAVLEFHGGIRSLSTRKPILAALADADTRVDASADSHTARGSALSSFRCWPGPARHRHSHIWRARCGPPGAAGGPSCSRFIGIVRLWTSISIFL